MKWRKSGTSTFKPKEKTDEVRANRQWLQPEFVRDSFRRLALLSKNSTLVISYRKDSMVSLEDITEIYNDAFSSLVLHEIRHQPVKDKEGNYDEILLIASNTQKISEL